MFRLPLCFFYALQFHRSHKNEYITCFWNVAMFHKQNCCLRHWTRLKVSAEDVTEKVLHTPLNRLVVFARQLFHHFRCQLVTGADGCSGRVVASWSSRTWWRGDGRRCGWRSWLDVGLWMVVLSVIELIELRAIRQSATSNSTNKSITYTVLSTGTVYECIVYIDYDSMFSCTTTRIQ